MGACSSKDTRDLQNLDLENPEFPMLRLSSEPECLYIEAPHRGAPRSESMVEMRTGVEQRIERSKCHWSEISTMKLGSTGDDGGETAKTDVDEEEEMARVKADNEQVFRSLQQHPTWGDFFVTFNDDDGECFVGSMEVGEKFAEGGQAEFFHAHITWWDPEYNLEDREEGTEWIVKVFKKGTLLRQLQHQWPQRLLQFYAEDIEQTVKRREPPLLRPICHVMLGTLLGDGRFAFVMEREHEDLRTRIDRHMTMRTGQHSGLFSEKTSKWMMFYIALGMEWLHSRDIVHRDLKASNVLCDKSEDCWDCFVADYECSVGVVGTGFWRAPEILQACEDRSIHEKPELFTKASDVYAYGMTCYEILTGKLPFEGQLVTINDIINGRRPEIPKYVDGDMRGLLEKCWQSNPVDRPSFKQLMQEPLFREMPLESA